MKMDIRIKLLIDHLPIDYPSVICHHPSSNTKWSQSHSYHISCWKYGSNQWRTTSGSSFISHPPFQL